MRLVVKEHTGRLPWQQLSSVSIGNRFSGLSKVTEIDTRCFKMRYSLKILRVIWSNIVILQQHFGCTVPMALLPTQKRSLKVGHPKNKIRFSSFFFQAGGKGGRFLFFILDELFLGLIDA